jgi:hypothetical protein
VFGGGLARSVRAAAVMTCAVSHWNWEGCAHWADRGFNQVLEDWVWVIAWLHADCCCDDIVR